MIYKYWLPVLALGLLAYALTHGVSTLEAPQPPTPQAEPIKAPFPDAIVGAGVVEPAAEKIAIGAPVPGIVVAVPVAVGQEVKKNQTLFRLDDRTLAAELVVRRSALATARAKLARLEEEPRSEEVRIKAAQVQAAQAQLKAEEWQLARGKKLHETKLVSAEELGRLQEAVAIARAQLAAAQAAHELTSAGASKSERALVRAEVAQAEALVEQADTEFQRLTIRAPSAGRLLQVNVHPGNFVSAPPLEPLLVLGDLSLPHIRVDIDEHDIPRFRPTAQARAVLKGRPQEDFNLVFVRVEPMVVAKRSLTGHPAERTDARVLKAIYRVDDPGRTLYVGQQLDVFIAAEAAK